MNTSTLSRIVLYAVLLLAACFFLAPLYVMLATSFKDAAQIRAGNLLSLPTSLNLDSWRLAWDSACTGVDCRGLKPYFVNSVVMAVPAVLISTAWGAVNGYVNAARIEGAVFWRIFWRSVLPLSTPILMVTLIWQFTNIWNDFLFGVAFSGADSKPITVGLNNMANTSSSVKSYNVDMAAAVIAGLPTMLVYVLAGQYFVKGLTAGAVKG